jgi:hypothetical protein
MPESLTKFLRVLFGSQKDQKLAAIGHAIIQACSPRKCMSPLQLALALQVHHTFRSRFLIDTLHALGFCSPYSEVLNFERNAAFSMLPELHQICENAEGQILMAADNVDHNLRTIDGHNTFHGMGMILGLTGDKFCCRKIPRMKRNATELVAEYICM